MADGEEEEVGVRGVGDEGGGGGEEGEEEEGAVRSVLWRMKVAGGHGCCCRASRRGSCLEIGGAEPGGWRLRSAVDCGKLVRELENMHAYVRHDDLIARRMMLDCFNKNRMYSY